MSNALSENAQVSTAFQAWSFQTPTDTLPAQFREEEVQPRVGEREWTTLSTSDAPLPFAPPAWDIPPPPEAAPSVDVGVNDMAEALLLAAQQEGERLKEEAYTAGFTAGEAQGFAKGQQRLTALLHGLGEALQEVGKLRALILQQSEQQLLELALAVARKVLHHEGHLNGEVILPLVQAGIKKATQRQELRIKVHPADMLFTASCKTQLLQCVDGIETITFEEDATVPPGSCMVETPAEIVDLRWDEQLEEVAASVFGMHERGEEAGNG